MIISPEIRQDAEVAFSPMRKSIMIEILLILKPIIYYLLQPEFPFVKEKVKIIKNLRKHFEGNIISIKLLQLYYFDCIKANTR